MLVKFSPYPHNPLYLRFYVDGKVGGSVLIDVEEKVKITLWVFSDYRFTDVGPYALRYACENSEQDEIWAQVPEGDRAMVHAFEKAGFELITNTPETEDYVYCWRRGEDYEEILSCEARTDLEMVHLREPVN